MNKKFNVGKLFLFGVVFSVLFSLIGCLQPNDGETKLSYSDVSAASDASLEVLKLGSENLSLTDSQIYKTVDNSVEKQMLEVVTSSGDATVIVKFKSAYAPIEPPDYEPRVDASDLISEDLEELDLYSNKCELHLGEGINIVYIKVISGNGKKTKNITIVITRKSADIPDGVDASVALKELKITCNGKTENLMKKINNNPIYAEGFVPASYYMAQAQLNVVPNDKDADVLVMLNGKKVSFSTYSHSSNLNDLNDKNIITVKVSKNTKKRIYTIHFNKLTETPTVVPVKSVSLNESKVTLSVGETIQLNASILPANATNQNVTWKSDRNYIASVSNDGVVTAKYAGYYSEARITVTTEDGNKTATCVVKVVKNNSTPGVPVKSVSLDKSEITLKVGETTKLKATVLPSNATNKKLTWGSNSYVASVSNEGEIQAKYEGTATITVTTEDGKKTDTCTVYIVKNTPTPVVVPVKSVSLNESEITLKVGETTKLKATVSPYNATNKKVLWSSNKSYVVSVSNTGEIEAKSNGTAIITVTTEDGHKTANCIVNVGDSDVPVKSVSLNESKVTLKVGETVKLIETVLPSNATNKHVSWRSSSSYIASVENGLVTAKYSGTTVITVTTDDGSKTASCTVIVKRPSNNARLSVLKLGSKTLSTYSSSIYETVPNSSSTVNLTVTTQDDKATKQIKLQKADEYTSQTITGSGDVYPLELNEGLNIVEIKITAEDGSTTKKVVLNITREKGIDPGPGPDPDPYEPPVGGKVNVKVNVISFIGGANVSGTTVEVYKNGSSSRLNYGTTNSNGDVSFKLELGGIYDFIAIGSDGRAGSRLEGVKIAYNGQVVTIVQRPGHPQEWAKAPEFLKVQYAEMKGNTVSGFKQFGDGSTFSKASYGVRQGIYLEIKSYGRAIITPWTQDGFGVGLGIGSRPTQYTKLGKIIYIDGAGQKMSDGSWLCKYFIDLEEVSVPNGQETMYIVAYDYAGNRAEKQIRVNFVADNGGESIKGSEIKNLSVDISRRPKPTYVFSTPNTGNDQIGTFGMDTVDGFETSIQVLVAFQVQKYGNTRINGFKVYRKEEGASKWAMVAHKAYGFPTGGGNYDFLPIKNAHFILDSEGGLYEGKTYNYYVEAYGNSESDTVKSAEITVTIMPSFYIELETPALNKVIDKRGAEFKFKVSNPALLDGKMSDRFEFGLLVMDKQGSHSQLTAFASKMIYVFNEVGDARLEIASSSSSYKTLDEWKRRVNALRGLSVEDLISYDKYSGIVTIKNAFLEIAEFNIGGTRRAFSQSVESGHAYHWDVQDWGVKTGDWRDDAAAKFEKIDVKNGIYSRSYSNLRGSDNGINGRLEFSVR